MSSSEPQPEQPSQQVKERRSRRSHKNSKDGCPNCRANRIKCSEDLPSCLQCTKKKYRCGYLDFPPEKLEHIRRKNEILKRKTDICPIYPNIPVIPDEGRAFVGSMALSTLSGQESSPVKPLYYANYPVPQQYATPPRTNNLPPMPSSYPRPVNTTATHPLRLEMAPYPPPRTAQTTQLTRMPPVSSIPHASANVITYPVGHQYSRLSGYGPRSNAISHAHNHPDSYAYAYPAQSFQNSIPQPSLFHTVNSTQPSSRPSSSSQPQSSSSSRPFSRPFSLSPSSPSSLSSSLSQPLPQSQPLVIPPTQNIAPAQSPSQYQTRPLSKPGSLSDLLHDPCDETGSVSLPSPSSKSKWDQQVQVQIQPDPLPSRMVPSSNQDSNDNPEPPQSLVEPQESHQKLEEVTIGSEAKVARCRSKDKIVLPGGRKKMKTKDPASHVPKTPASQVPKDPVSTSVRSMVYSNMIRDATANISSIDTEALSNFKPWIVGHPFGTEDLELNNPFFSNDFSSMADVSSEIGHSPSHLDRSSPNSQRSLSASAPQSVTSPKEPVKFLPNCKFKLTKFKVLEVPPNMQSNLFEETVKDLKQEGAHIQFHTNVKSEYMRPVYHDREFHMLWVEIFLRATVFDLFFIYFIDKSLNILMRASEKIVNGDLVYSPFSDSSRSSSVSGLDRRRSKSHHFFYNKEDLDILTAKSYTTYGRVIRELRNSINLYSAEFPARMSLFSAWACYMYRQSDLETFGHMIRGTLVLFKSKLNQCIAENTPGFSMHREFSILESFVRQSLYPDYNFNVVRNLEVDFQKFRSIVDRLVVLHEDGWDIDEEISAVVSDPVFRHDFHELTKFFDKLLNNIQPQIAAQNRHYKALNNFSENHNIHFASPSLLFSMTHEWFYMFPDEKMYMSSKISPIKKVLYMFFHALANCLSHTLTPIRSVSLADACNVTCTKVGMIFSKPTQLDSDYYEALQPMLRNLMRTIRFFETRSKLFAYYVVDRSVLDEEFIKPAPYVSSPDWKHNDVVHILPAKLEVREKQIENFSQSIFAVHNFPFFEELYDDPTTADLIHMETERQHQALQNERYEFDYCLGLSNHDFNPNKIVDYYCSKKKNALDTLPPIPNDKLNVRMDHMLSGRDAITKCCENKGGLGDQQ
ncbi:hypothetical protein JCM33374_g4380 [Metschnikowia sp. JCM 33374]|nr:hypothetical protein JCM33374_g4380 [Metschnikowia sp. JCM 33374]